MLSSSRNSWFYNPDEAQIRVDVSRVRGIPTFTRLMEVTEVSMSFESSLITLKQTVLLKQAESVFQPVANTTMHLRLNGGFLEFIVPSDCITSVLSLASAVTSTLMLVRLDASDNHC